MRGHLRISCHPSPPVQRRGVPHFCESVSRGRYGHQTLTSVSFQARMLEDGKPAAPEARSMLAEQPSTRQLGGTRFALLGRTPANLQRSDNHEVEQQISMDPDQKYILWVKAVYEAEQLKSLRALARIQQDHHLPSERWWGRVDEMQRDTGYFEVIGGGRSGPSPGASSP